MLLKRDMYVMNAKLVSLFLESELTDKTFLVLLINGFNAMNVAMFGG